MCLAFSAASCLITISSNRAVGTLAETSPVFRVELRLQNAVFSYVRYAGKTLRPCNLAVFCPYPEALPAWRAVLCGLLLLGISGWALVTARSRAYLLVGWFWFLGVVVPFVGLRQAGE